MFNSDFFKNNRINLTQQLGGDGLAIITAHGVLQRSGDTTFPFRQESNFYYLTGIEEADMVLVIAHGEEFLIAPKRSRAEAIFGGDLDYDAIQYISGIENIYEHAEGWKRYKKMQQNRKEVYTLGAAPEKITHLDSFYTNPARRRLIQKIKRMNPNIAVEDIREILVRLREVKQPAEIAAIKHAISITAEGFERAQGLLRSGVSESEIATEFTKIFLNHNTGHSYHPIVAGGERACILHYNKNNQPLQQGELCLLDVGAEYNNYAADITRTFPVGSKTPRQQEVYEAVLRIHHAAIALLSNGLKWREYALQVHELMSHELITLGLIKNNTRNEVRRYFPHAISHSLGLDVHDVCKYDTIREGMVITVEPGIYIPEEGIGVRIEDDILITKDGAHNLSSYIPYDIS